MKNSSGSKWRWESQSGGFFGSRSGSSLEPTGPDTPTMNSSFNTSTIYQNISVSYKKAINAIAVDSTGKYAVLGGKKGLYIVDLDDPYEPIKSLNQQSKWEVNIVEWNPHQSKASYIASTANQNTLIWNVDDERGALQATLQTHQRAVSDLSWSLYDPVILATCSADTYINLWDVRDPKKPIKLKSFCGWTAGATQVKWNRKNPMVLASAHNGEVRIWDIRKVSSPTTFITAHMAKIYGIDWSYTDENDLVTCSEDKQVKFWNATMPRVCKGILQSSAPILRSRYTPFGRGLVTMAQRTDFTLRLWSLDDLNTAVHGYSGHTDIITSFDWRIREVNGKKEYQLVTWSKDQTLRLWYVDKKQQDACSRSTPLTIVKKKAEDVTNGIGSSPSESKFSPSPFSPSDLAQEAALVEKKKPRGIVIEELNVQERYCIAYVVGKPSTKLKIIFPSLYPHNAIPSFQFLPSTTLSTPLRAKVIEALTDTASLHVDENRPCLYQCLCQLFILLKDTPDEEDSNASTMVSSNMQINPLQDTIPCPRTSSAVFSNGKIIYFNNLKLNFTSMRVRTYRDFKSTVKDHLTSGSTLSALDDSRVSSAFSSLSNLFYSGVQDLTSRISYRQDSIGSGHTQLAGSGIVTIKKCDLYLPISENLGRNYLLSGTDVNAICDNNSKVALDEKRYDLVRVWNTVKLLLHSTVYYVEDKESVLSHPWASHPIAQSTIASIFKHYQKLKDVQTLAALCCVLSLPPHGWEKEEPVPPPPPLPVETRNRTGSGKLSSSSSTSIITSIMQKKHRRSRSQTMTPLLDSHLRNLHDQFKTFYAEILYSWGLLDKRAEVLKFIRLSAPTKHEIGYLAFCNKCGRPIQGNTGNCCSICKVYAVSCSICHLPVKGLSNFCMACGHGGHANHMKAWFITNSLCPTGCGCECLSQDVYM